MAEKSPDRLSESLQRFSGILTRSEIQQITKIQEEPLSTGIRINLLKADPQAAINALADRYGWQVKPVPFCPNAWSIEAAEFPPGRTIEHRMGVFYLQDAASMVPVSLLDINQPRPIILDMAASPGGKTTHLVDRTLDRGFILANDASQGRIPALRSVLTTWGGINLAVTNFPGESFGDWFPETFDAILLDAPCSMENLRPTPSHPLRETTQTERLRLQDRQVQLLISAITALKTDGQVVYATCSMAPEEDEAVIDRVLKAYPGAFVIEDVSPQLPFNAPGLISFKGETYNPTLVHALRLWPHLTGMSGFFCARLKKVNSIPSGDMPPPSRDFSRTDLHPASPDQQNQFYDQVGEDYGIDMWEITRSLQVELYSRHAGLFLIPKAYLDNFINLPFEYIGMALGQWISGQWQPSHAFISRFGGQFSRGMIKIHAEQVDQWIAGRDIRNPETRLTPQGQYLLVVDQAGRNLGLGKLLPKRLRNMLPRTAI
jgi:16S rRNA (cytosine1407-C5)-methyltransferase